MILADTNFWLALVLSKHDFHQAARNWFDQQSQAESILFCRSTQQSFLRLLTTEAVMRPYDLAAMTNAAAWTVFEGFISDGRIAQVADEPTALEARWKRFAARTTASPKLWMDAYLAAFAVAAGHAIVTTDRAFAQFKGLKSIILARG